MKLQEDKREKVTVTEDFFRGEKQEIFVYLIGYRNTRKNFCYIFLKIPSFYSSIVTTFFLYHLAQAEVTCP
jgi:hypothetical protein